MSTSFVEASAPAAGARSRFGRFWPAALGVLVALGTAYGLSDGRDVASVVVASGFVYLAAAAVGARGAAWPAFGLTFVLVGLAKFELLDAAVWIAALGGIAVVGGIAAGRWEPRWRLPLQAAAMLALGLIAVVAVRVDLTVGGYLISAALLAHAAWDVYHHRRDRVVTRALAEFCCALDVVLAAAVAVVTATA